MKEVYRDERKERREGEKKTKNTVEAITQKDLLLLSVLMHFSTFFAYNKNCAIVLS